MVAVLKDVLNTKPLNTYDGPEISSFEIVLNGSYLHMAVCELTMPGVGNIVIKPLVIGLPGTKRVLNTYELEAIGGFDLALVRVIGNLPGVCKQYVTYIPEMPGVRIQQASYEIGAASASRIMIELELAMLGASQYGRGLEIVVAGRHNINQKTYTRCYRQGYRVADTTLETLELYAGYNEMPDFNDVAQPVATGDPISWTPVYPAPGETTVLHLVVRSRNRYGLLSHNQKPELIEIDSDGATVLGPLSTPEFIKVLDGSLVGSIQVWARYLYENDRNPADIWEIYAGEGVDPVIGIDAPIYTETITGVGVGILPWRTVIEDLTPGVTYHLQIAIRRTADGAYVQGGILLHTVALVYIVDEVDLAIFAGDEYEIQQ